MNCNMTVIQKGVPHSVQYVCMWMYLNVLMSCDLTMHHVTFLLVVDGAPSSCAQKQHFEHSKGEFV